MKHSEKSPAEMTLEEFTRWRIIRALQAGIEVRMIAKSLGISRCSVWRVVSRCNLQHGDNCHHNAIDECTCGEQSIPTD